MSQPPNPLLEDTALGEPVFERLKGLSKTAMLILVAAALLVVDLFGTWQTLEIDFGPAGTATSMLDGWDFWGLLIALTAIGLITVVVVVYASEIDIPEDVRWELWIFVGAAALFALTVVKNLTDADSAWASYVGVVLAAIVLAGAFRNWAATRRPQRRRFRRSTRSSPGPS